jgi:hypothetical protein
MVATPAVVSPLIFAFLPANYPVNDQATLHTATSALAWRI